MSLLALVLLLVVVGVLLPMIPMDDRVRRIVIAVLGILVLAYLVALLFGAARVPVLRVGARAVHGSAAWDDRPT